MWLRNPFHNIFLFGKKPRNAAYPKELNSIGDHICQVRLDKGLRQKDVALMINASEATIYNWENNRSIPMVSYMSKIISFLEYQSFLQEDSKSWSSIIFAYRQKRGIRRNVLAKEIGIDERTKQRNRLFISNIAPGGKPDEYV